MGDCEIWEEEKMWDTMREKSKRKRYIVKRKRESVIWDGILA